MMIEIRERSYNMNSNAVILRAILLGLLISFLLGMKALGSQPFIRKKIYVSMTLLVVSGSLIGGISVWWRITHPQPYTPEPAPLPAQSQVIIRQWDKQGLHVSHSSLSGRDGIVHWSNQDQSPCTENRYFTLSNGIVYQRGAMPDKQEICVQALRLSDGAQLWSTTIKSTQPPGNLIITGNPDADKLLMVRGALYLQVDDILYKLDIKDGKILDKITPDIIQPGAVFVNFASNNDELALQYNFSSGLGDPLLDTLVVLQVSDDKVLWKSEPGRNQKLLAVQGNTLYTQRGSIVALRVRDGVQLWKASLPELSIVKSSASSEHVYLRAQNSPGSADAAIYTLSAPDGRLLWKVPVTSWNGGAPTEANGIAYIADTNTLSAFQANTGRLLWRYKESPLPSTAIGFNPYDIMYFSQPEVVNGVVFVATNFTTSFPPPLRLIPDFCFGQCTPRTGINALRASDGQLYWHYQTQSQVALLAAYES
jgi:outer membrane protein assembly factor BamB